MTKLATTLIGSLGLLTAGVAGCSAPVVAEEQGGSSSHIEGVEGAMEFDISKGKHVYLSGGAIQFCSKEAPDAAQMVEKVNQDPDRYLVPYKNNKGAGLVVTGGDDRTNGVYVAGLPMPWFSAACDGGEGWRIPIQSDPGDLATELGAALKFVLERSFGGGGDKWSCTAGGKLATPFITMGEDRWGVIDGNLVPPRIDVGFTGKVEAEIGLECAVTLGEIPTPYPWLELEIEAKSGASTDVSGAINMSASTKERPNFTFPGTPKFSVGLGIKARAFKLFAVGVSISISTDKPGQLASYDCSRELSLEVAGTVTAGLDPKLPLNLVNAYMVSADVSAKGTIPPMCEGRAQPEEPPAEQPKGDDCAEGRIGPDDRLCGRSPGTERSLYRCEGNQWVETPCDNGCFVTGESRDYCTNGNGDQ